MYETYVPYSKSNFTFHQEYEASDMCARITPPYPTSAQTLIIMLVDKSVIDTMATFWPGNERFCS